MTNIKALEKLRELCADVKSMDFASVGCDAVLEIADEIEQEIAELQESWAQEAREHADDSARLAELAHENAELKREISERFVELPVDADGVPIHVGDYLESEEYGGRQFPCRGLNVEVCNSGKRWTVCMSYDSYSGTSEYTSASRCRHVNPRTIEDVLHDFWEEWESHPIDAEWGVRLERLRESEAKYADEIRELMEVRDD